LAVGLGLRPKTIHEPPKYSIEAYFSLDIVVENRKSIAVGMNILVLSLLTDGII